MKKILLTLTLSFAVATMYAQEVYSSTGKPLDEKNKTNDEEEERGFNSNNLILGGGFVFGIGSGITNLGVSPVIGYRFTEKFSAGVGLGYQYYSEKNPVYKFKTAIYSGSLWARYILFQNIFLHVEPEMNSLEVFTPVFDNTNTFLGLDHERKLVPSLLVGGGLRQPISDRVSFVGLILYDVLQDPNSPYNGIALRFGINAGF